LLEFPGHDFNRGIRVDPIDFAEPIWPWRQRDRAPRHGVAGEPIGGPSFVVFVAQLEPTTVEPEAAVAKFTSEPEVAEGHPAAPAHDNFSRLQTLVVPYRDAGSVLGFDCLPAAACERYKSLMSSPPSTPAHDAPRLAELGIAKKVAAQARQGSGAR
jgi:hypothetical protein